MQDPLVFTVPIASLASGPVNSGTGKVNAPTGTGSADFYISSDGTHPTQIGINDEAIQYAARIKAIVINALK